LKPEQGRSYIPIIKYPASTTPYKGMILANPGGPGDPGTSWIMQGAESVAGFLGTNYDLVSWDPRGVGYALPAANCTLSSNITVPTSKRRGLDKLYGPEIPVQYFENSYEVWHHAGQVCKSQIGGQKDAGPHMATATVAKDMLSIVDAYSRSAEGKKCEGNASLVNYWGFSYGTFLGQTFASLFPARVGRYVLDGVVDPDDWISGNGVTEITVTDEVFSTFFIYCNLAGSTSCPFYTGTTAHDIYLRFEAIINKLNATYAIQQNWANATAIEIVLQGVKQQTLSWLYTPMGDSVVGNGNFSSIAEFLVGVEDLLHNLTLANVEAAAKQFGIDVSATQALSAGSLRRFAVSCSDRSGKDYGRTLQSFTGDIGELEAASWLAGETHAADLFACAAWDIHARDRFGGTFARLMAPGIDIMLIVTGPFGGKTKNPILFVGNTLDPVTPITK
jgi:pimeloyl-ACP methyl ester carboxylesterase